MATSPPFVTQEATAQDGRNKCPYASVAFEPGNTIAVCCSCATKHLMESWEENGGCTTYGCENAPDFRKDRDVNQNINLDARAAEHMPRTAVDASSCAGPPFTCAAEHLPKAAVDASSFAGPPFMCAAEHLTRTAVDAGSSPIAPSVPPQAIQQPNWLPRAGDLRMMITWVGFVTGLVGMASPSYWGSGIGLVVSSVAVGVNLAKADSRMATYSVVGIIAAILGFIFAAIADAW